MTCQEARPLFGAHLDHELDARSSLEFEAHLRTSATCQAELADLATLQSAAREGLSRFVPSPAFETRLAAALPLSLRHGRPPRPRRGWLTGAGAGAALAAAAALLLFFLVRPGDGRNLGREIVDAHTRSLLVDHATDVPSRDRYAVKPWFRGKVPFGVPVADFSASGLPLVGGRLDYVGGREVAALVYKRRNHLINVFVWPDPTDVAHAEVSERGYSVRHFARGGLAWWLVTDDSPADLRELEALIIAE